MSELPNRVQMFSVPITQSGAVTAITSKARQAAEGSEAWTSLLLARVSDETMPSGGGEIQQGISQPRIAEA